MRWLFRVIKARCDWSNTIIVLATLMALQSMAYSNHRGQNNARQDWKIRCHFYALLIGFFSGIVFNLFCLIHNYIARTRSNIDPEIWLSAWFLSQSNYNISILCTLLAEIKLIGTRPIQIMMEFIETEMKFFAHKIYQILILINSCKMLEFDDWWKPTHNWMIIRISPMR